MTGDNAPDERAELIQHCRDAGDPALGLVIAGEGNAGIRTSRGTILVTASGARLARCDATAIVELDPAALMRGLVSGQTDEQWADCLMASRVSADNSGPTVEAALHAVVMEACDARVTLHTHPNAVIGVLCSPEAAKFAAHPLFPDHVVMCGPAACLVPYVDPGLELAVAARSAIANFRAEHGVAPLVILLENHGMIAAASTTTAALDATMMTVKAADITSRSAALGGPRPLSRTEIVRIDSRVDEHYRRAILAGER